MGGSFEGAWQRNGELDVPEEEPVSNLCQYARSFSEWFERRYADLAQGPSIVKITQEKVLALDKYMDWRAYAPKRHRRYTATGQGSHTCLFHVFEESYNRLKVLELSLTPPMLFLPPPPAPPPAPPPPVQVSGIFLGEEE